MSLKDASGWDGVEDTDPAVDAVALVASGYDVRHAVGLRGALGFAMVADRGAPHPDVPIDFVPVEARCSEIDPAGAVT